MLNSNNEVSASVYQENTLDLGSIIDLVDFTNLCRSSDHMQVNQDVRLNVWQWVPEQGKIQKSAERVPKN